MSSGKINTLFIYGVAILLIFILIFSLLPTYNINIETTQIVLIVIIVVLLLFKYFDVIEILGFLKLRKEINEIKNETKEIKQAQMSLMQNLSITQSAIASNVNYFFPIFSQAKKDAKEEAETLLTEHPSVGEANLSASLQIIKNDTDRIRDHIYRREYIAAFTYLRSTINTLLKEIFGFDKTKYMPINKIIHDLEKRQILTSSLSQSIYSVRKFANIVVHMPPSTERDLPPSEVDKIVELGIRVIGELESIKKQKKDN